MDWFVLLAGPGTLKSLPATQFKSINSLALSLLYGPTLTCIHDHWENCSFHYTDFYRQSNVSAFQYAARLVITFLSRSKRLLISWLQSPFAMILEPKKINKSVSVSTFSPSICHKMMGLDAMKAILGFVAPEKIRTVVCSILPL